MYILYVNGDEEEHLIFGAVLDGEGHHIQYVTHVEEMVKILDSGQVPDVIFISTSHNTAVDLRTILPEESQNIPMVFVVNAITEEQVASIKTAAAKATVQKGMDLKIYKTDILDALRKVTT